MFNLTIVDHVRLSFGHAVQNYTLHTQSADRLRTFSLYAKMTILTLLAAAIGLGAWALLGGGRAVHIAIIVTSALAFAVYAVVTALSPDERIARHRFHANRLWLLCEGYRALLAEIHDGLLERGQVLERRDALIQQFHDIHAQGSPPDDASGTALKAVRAGRPLTEEQIDQFLPASLRKAVETPEPAPASQ
jgi:hypothetical protein